MLSRKQEAFDIKPFVLRCLGGIEWGLGVPWQHGKVLTLKGLALILTCLAVALVLVVHAGQKVTILTLIGGENAKFPA